MTTSVTGYIHLETIDLDFAAASKSEAIERLVDLIGSTGAIVDRTQFVTAVLERETLSTTGLGDGIAIPHGKSDGIGRPTVAFARSSSGIDWGSPDGTPAHLLFLIGVPEAAAGNEHLVILARLARALMREEFRNRLYAADTSADAMAILAEVAS